METSPEDGLGHLRIVVSPTAYIGPGRADLLQQLQETGSISAAGRAMGMSYKRAWSLVQAMNQGFGSVLVLSSRGGAEQGGAELTEDGRFVLERYRAMQHKARVAIAEDVGFLHDRFDMSGRK